MQAAIFSTLSEKNLSIGERLKKLNWSKAQAREFFSEPGILDQFFDYNFNYAVGMGMAKIVEGLVTKCEHGSQMHLKMLLQILNKLQPDMEQHLHLQFAQMDTQQLKIRLQNLSQTLESIDARKPVAESTPGD